MFDLVPSTLGISDGTLSSLISTYNASQLERKSLIDANIPATNARVRQKDDQLERLRVNILENLDNLVNSYKAAIQRFKENTGELLGKMQQLPEKQQELEEIKQQRNMKQTVYNLLMQKREESAISSAATISNIKVLEEAVPNRTPISPDKGSIRLIAIIIGLSLPALFIVGVELLNDKITTRSDIEKLTAAPILGEVGHAFGDETLVVKSHNRGIVAEQFRIIRSNLQYILARNPKSVLLITSSFSGEGKSFVSTNMGAVMSLANKKTIVLEFDIRKPKVLSGLGIPKKPGLTNYLLGKIPLEELPIPVQGYENYFVLACGPLPPNPAELLLDPKLGELFTYLKQEFDVIIIDTAPVGMVSDAMTLSQFADATLYIVRQGHTFKKQIGLIDDYYQSNKLPKISIVMNDVKVRSGYGYYGYGRYGYGYGYGAGYFEDDEKPPSFLRTWFGWLDAKTWKRKKRKKRRA
jgi:capsular exopolysaccharide synthesis family protein